MGDVDDANRAMSIVIKDICGMAVEKSIPLCLPNAIGLDHVGDYSRIVYFP